LLQERNVKISADAVAGNTNVGIGGSLTGPSLAPGRIRAEDHTNQHGSRNPSVDMRGVHSARVDGNAA
jgi:hypothetical protein